MSRRHLEIERRAEVGVLDAAQFPKRLPILPERFDFVLMMPPDLRPIHREAASSLTAPADGFSR